jgi:hypothetical protein
MTHRGEGEAVPGGGSYVMGNTVLYAEGVRLSVRSLIDRRPEDHELHQQLRSIFEDMRARLRKVEGGQAIIDALGDPFEDEWVTNTQDKRAQLIERGMPTIAEFLSLPEVPDA